MPPAAAVPVTPKPMPRRVYPSLDAYLKFDENRGTATQLAQELDIAPSYLSLIRAGLRMPALDLALKISRRCKVPIESLIPNADQPAAAAGIPINDRMMMQTTDTIAHEMAQEILKDLAFRAELLELVRRFVKRRPRAPRLAPEDMLRVLKDADQKRYDALALLIARAFTDLQQPGDEESA